MTRPRAPGAAELLRGLLAWKTGPRGRYLNVADVDNETSRNIAAAWARRLGIRSVVGRGQTEPAVGHEFQERVAAYLTRELARLDRRRRFGIGTRRIITEFLQYRHLAELKSIMEREATGTLQATIGSDYIIRPDVVVTFPTSDTPFLHASISCKWTIRSDRVQNARHEAVILIRHRRGRTPHIVAVTAEPLPTRLASIAEGTGEIDCVYHADLENLRLAVEQAGTPGQRKCLERLVGTSRLADQASRTLPSQR